jgi:hypothetical protein
MCRAWHTGPMAAHVKLSGELSGEYVVEDVLEDGRVVLRPDTSAEAIRLRGGLEPVTDQEFDRAFGHLPSDDEG